MTIRAWASGVGVALIYAFLLAPSIVIVLTSFDAGDASAFPPASLSLKWYVSFFSSPEFVHSLFSVSLIVALIVSGAATVIGGLAAVALVRFAGRSRGLMETIFLLPLVLPGILLGAALYLFYSRVHIRGLASLVLGHLVIAVPYVIRTMSAGLAGANRSLEEAAQSLGATPSQAFLKVTLPVIRSALLSAAVFAFIISFSDVNLALFIAGPGTFTLPLQIFSQVTTQSDPTVAAASALQMGLIVVLLLLAQRFFKLRVGL